MNTLLLHLSRSKIGLSLKKLFISMISYSSTRALFLHDSVVKDTWLFRNPSVFMSDSLLYSATEHYCLLQKRLDNFGRLLNKHRTVLQEIYTYICMYIYIFLYIYIRAYTCICKYDSCIHRYIQVYAHIQTHLYIHIHIYPCTQICTEIYRYVDIHIISMT